MTTTEKKLYDAFDSIPKIDVHTHLPLEIPAAHRASDLVFYHMLFSELRSAGMTEAPPDRRRDEDDSHVDWPAMMRKTVPYFRRTANTAVCRAFVGLCRDLYGITRPVVDEGFMDELRASYDQHADRRAWSEQLFTQMNVERAMASMYGVPWKRKDYCDSLFPRLTVAIERDPYHSSASMAWIARRMKEKYGFCIDTADKAREETMTQLERSFALGARTQLKWVSNGRIARTVDPAKIDAAFRKIQIEEDWTPDDVAHLNAFDLQMRLEFARERGQTFQLFSMALHLPGCAYTSSLTPQDFLITIGEWINRYPDVTFDILNCDYTAEPFFTSIARTHPNVNMSGVWWHGMSEGWLEDIIYRRILAVPVWKQCGFFSDAYSAEWIWGKILIVRQPMVRAFARAIENGYFGLEQAVEYMRMLLYDNPKRLHKLSTPA